MIHKNFSSPKNIVVSLLFLFASLIPTQAPVHAEGYTDVALTIGATAAVSTSIFTAAAYYAYKQACKKSLQLPPPTFAAFMQSIFAKAHAAEELKKAFVTTKKNIKTTKKLMGTEELHPKLMFLALACEGAMLGSCFHAYKNFKPVTAPVIKEPIKQKIQTHEIGINTEKPAPLEVIDQEQNSKIKIIAVVVGNDQEQNDDPNKNLIDQDIDLSNINQADSKSSDGADSKSSDDDKTPLSREKTGTFGDGSGSDINVSAATGGTNNSGNNQGKNSGTGKNGAGTEGTQSMNKTREYPDLVNETVEATLERIGLTDLGPSFNYIWLLPTARERKAAFENIIRNTAAKPNIRLTISPQRKAEIIKTLENTTDFVEFEVLRALLQLQKKLNVPTTKAVELTPLKTKEREEKRRNRLNTTPPPKGETKTGEYQRSASAPTELATTTKKKTTKKSPVVRAAGPENARSQSAQPAASSRSSSPSPIAIPTLAKLRIKK